VISFTSRPGRIGHGDLEFTRRMVRRVEGGKPMILTIKLVPTVAFIVAISIAGFDKGQDHAAGETCALEVHAALTL
jgi:hypothetical protein